MPVTMQTIKMFAAMVPEELLAFYMTMIVQEIKLTTNRIVSKLTTIVMIFYKMNVFWKKHGTVVVMDLVWLVSSMAIVQVGQACCPTLRTSQPLNLTTSVIVKTIQIMFSAQIQNPVMITPALRITRLVHQDTH